MQLSHVNVSNGEWHVAHVSRVGAWVSLQVDFRFGRFFNQTFAPTGSHREILVAQAGLVAGGNVPSMTSSDVTISDSDLHDSCLDDFRFNDHWVPLLPSDVNSKYFAISVTMLCPFVTDLLLLLTEPSESGW